jgi:hypothetical protein
MPSSMGGMGGMGGGGGSTATSPSAPEVPGMDYNLTGDALLKQYTERKQASPMEGGEAARKQLETDGVNKQQAEAAAKQKAEDDAVAKKKEEEDRKKQQEQKPQENPSVLLAELNTKMAKLIDLSTKTTNNTYATYEAAKGLNNNLYKA